jgi:hypothetical protein
MLALGNLSKAPGIAPEHGPMPPAIEAEAVFTMTPRQMVVTAPDPEQQPQAQAEMAKPVKAPAKPKPVIAARASGGEPRQVAMAAPLPIVPVAAPPESAIEPVRESRVMRSLRGAGAAVRNIPRWAANTMSGWLPEAEPPRPPAPIPLADFQASM